MIISNITSLPIDNPHAVAVDYGIATNPIPVRDKVIELAVVALIGNVSHDFNFGISVCYFFISFCICCFYL